MLRFLQHTKLAENSVEDTVQQNEMSIDMTSGRTDNRELKRIIYGVTAFLAMTLFGIGGGLYTKMEQRVTTIEANNQLILEVSKRVVTLEDWVKDHNKESLNKIEEYAKSITALTVEVNLLKKSLDNMSQSQDEMLKTLRTLEISDARRDKIMALPQ